MSPKSRGRPPGRRRPAHTKHPRGPVRPRGVADHVLHEARQLRDDTPRLLVEAAASGWLGHAWAQAPLEARTPERDLVTAVAGRLAHRHAPHAVRGLLAMRTVLAAEDRQYVDEQLAGVPDLRPAWAGEVEWVPRRGWRGTDVYESERVLVVEFDGPQPHDLLVRILTTGGVTVDQLILTEPGVHDRWQAAPADIALGEQDVAAVLAELADTLRTTDMYWPRLIDPEYVRLRALAHARSRSYLKKDAAWEPMADAERQALLDAFVAEAGLDLPEESVRVLADLFLDFGDGYLAAGPLAWSPGEVERFLLDWAPRKTVLDAEDRALLPRVLRAWVGFALRRRGRASEADIARVVAVVDELTDEFEAAYDDESAWGMGKQVIAALQAEGVDLSDKAAVEQGIRAYNAAQLARRLTEGGPREP